MILELISIFFSIFIFFLLKIITLVLNSWNCEDYLYQPVKYSSICNLLGIINHLYR